MKILTAAYYEFLKNIRDIKMVAILLLFPIITVYILGNAIGTLYNNDIAAKIPIGVFADEGGSVSTEFQKFLDSDELRKKITITEFHNLTSGEKAMSDGQIDVLINVQENPSAILLSGKNNVEFIESLVSNFVSSYNSVATVLTETLTPTLPTYEEISIERIYYTKNMVTPKIIDYYSVLTLLQILIIGAILGIYIMHHKPNTDMHIRIHSLPISKWGFIFGQTLGSVTYLFLAAISVIFFTKYVYGANWNGNILIIAGTIFSFCLISVGIGLLVGILVKNSAIGLMIVLLLMMFFGTVSGAITPATISESISVISPNHHAKQLLFGTIYGYSNEIMLQAALSLGGFAIIIFSFVTIFVGRRKNYDHF